MAFSRKIQLIIVTDAYSQHLPYTEQRVKERNSQVGFWAEFHTKNRTFVNILECVCGTSYAIDEKI